MKKRFLSGLLILAMVVALMVPVSYAQEPVAPTVTADMLQTATRGNPNFNLHLPTGLMEGLQGVVNQKMYFSTMALSYGYSGQYAFYFIYSGTADKLADEPEDYGYTTISSISGDVELMYVEWTPTKTGSYVFITATADASGKLISNSLTAVEFEVLSKANPATDFTLHDADTDENTRLEGNTIYIRPDNIFFGALQLYPLKNTSNRELKVSTTGAEGCFEYENLGGDLLIYAEACGEGTLTLTLDGVVKTYNVVVCNSLWGHVMRETREEYCEAPGRVVHACNNCNYYYVEEIPAQGHNWKLKETLVPPTVVDQGVNLYECTRCGQEKGEAVPSLQETFEAFTDLDESQWYYEAAQYAVYNGLFNGVSSTSFAPDKTMNRAMLVTVLWRYSGSPEAGTAPFTDVSADQWFAPGVAWAAEKGIVNGVAPDRFAPTNTITREQMAAVLFRFANMLELDTTERLSLGGFADGDQVSGYAVEALQWCVSQGIITGSTSHGRLYLNPQKGATRAQVAAILMRFIENVVEK